MVWGGVRDEGWGRGGGGWRGGRAYMIQYLRALVGESGAGMWMSRVLRVERGE